MDENKKKIKSWHIVFLLILGISFIGMKIWQRHWPEAVVSLKDTELYVLVAKTPKPLYQGLGGREYLVSMMLCYIFGSKAKQGIVMRNMKFPIDIVWFDDGVVVDLVSNVKPEFDVPEEKLMVYYPRVEANAVLELPAGWALRHNLKIGDKIALVEE
jgi:uncharacterized membrane protein (UPF0127 family)